MAAARRVRSACSGVCRFRVETEVKRETVSEAFTVGRRVVGVIKLVHN